MNGEVSDPEFSGQETSYAWVKPLDLSVFATRLRIEYTVAAVFAVPQEALRCKTRGCAKVAFARQVAMYLAHVSCSITLTQVGQIFERDRTTVAHACRTIEDCRDDPNFDLVLDLLDCIVTQPM